MEAQINKFIPKFTFTRSYGLWSESRYDQFLCFVSEQIAHTIDKETSIVSLSIQNKWQDQGGNIHASLRGKISRRNEEAEIGAEIVWLKRLKTFRGNVWSHLSPKSDNELYSEARLLFHTGKYSEFLGLAKYIEDSFSNNRVFSKMKSIAGRRV